MYIAHVLYKNLIHALLFVFVHKIFIFVQKFALIETYKLYLL